MFKRLTLLVAAAGLAGYASIVSPAAAMAEPASWPLAGRINHLCVDVGLAPDEIAFTYCVISLKASVELAAEMRLEAGPPVAVGPAPGATPTGPGSFFRSPPVEQHAREGGACASLGFIPHSSIFRQCVSSLDRMLTQTTFVGGDR